MKFNSAVIKKYWWIVLFNFLVLSCMGLILRYISYSGITPFNYVHILQAHAHFAFSAVLFLSVICALTHVYIPLSYSALQTFSLIFWLTLVESYAMLYSFSRYGYNYLSIIISTVYLLTTYYYSYFFYTSTKKLPRNIDLITAYVALFFLAISTIGIWCMGPLMIKGYSGKPLYYNTVYFYLHFQYNGWFTFAVLALYIRYLNLNFIPKKIIYLFATATSLLYFISTLWCEPASIFYGLSFAGAIIQLYCFFYFLKHIKTPLTSTIFWVIFLSIILKITLQFLSAIPYFAKIAAQNRNLIIAYLHLVFIGTLIIPLYYYFEKELSADKIFRYHSSLFLFLFTFILTEVILLYTPFCSNYSWITTALVYASIGYPISILGLLIYACKQKNSFI
jgi:hypothetical protein